MSCSEESKDEIPYWLERETKESDEIYAKKFFDKFTKDLTIESSSSVLLEELCKEYKNKKKQQESLVEETRLTDIAEDEAIALSLVTFQEHQMLCCADDETVARSLQEQEENIQRQIQLDFKFASNLK